MYLAFQTEIDCGCPISFNIQKLHFFDLIGKREAYGNEVRFALSFDIIKCTQ